MGWLRRRAPDQSTAQEQRTLLKAKAHREAALASINDQVEFLENETRRLVSRRAAVAGQAVQDAITLDIQLRLDEIDDLAVRRSKTAKQLGNINRLIGIGTQLADQDSLSDDIVTEYTLRFEDMQASEADLDAAVEELPARDSAVKSIEKTHVRSVEQRLRELKLDHAEEPVATEERPSLKVPTRRAKIEPET